MENTVDLDIKQKSPKVKKVHTIRLEGLNKPWILLLIPGLIGAIWLANNTWVITNNLDKPYTLYAGPATIGSILLGWCVVKFFTAIVAWCKAAWQAFQRARKEDGSAQFFWIVIVVFMVVSVFSSGAFFTTIEHNALPGLGYATALFIDLVAVQSMRARLNAVRMRDKKGAALYLFGVLVCAGASAFANVYTSLSDFSAQASHALPVWMNSVAPWFGLVFPLLILLLSITADYTIDQVSTKLDPEQYREQEAKRTKLVEYQLEALQQRVQFETQIERLTNRLKERREFFLLHWLMPKAAPSVVQVVDQVAAEMKKLYEPRIQVLSEHLQLVATQNMQLRTEMLAFVAESKQAYGNLAWGVHQQIELLDGQKDTDLRLITEQIDQAKKETISQVENRLKDAREKLLFEVVSQTENLHIRALPTAQENGDEHPFSREDEFPFDDEDTTDLPDTQNDVEVVAETSGKSERKATKTVKKTGYQIENDLEVIKLLDTYPNVQSWLSRSAKSANLDEIVNVTGHSHKMVKNRISDTTLKKTKNPNLITMESIIKWLSSAPLPRSKGADKEEINQGNDVPQTPAIDVQVSDHLSSTQTDTQTDENLTDTGEHEVIHEDVFNEDRNNLEEIDLQDYQPVPVSVEMAETTA